MISPDGLWTVTEQVAPSGPSTVTVPPGQTASVKSPPVELVIVMVNVWDAHAGGTAVLQMMVPFALNPITWVPVGQEVPAALLGSWRSGRTCSSCRAGGTLRACGACGACGTCGAGCALRPDRSGLVPRDRCLVVLTV